MERTLENIFKAEWEPYVGPQGGKGWRNTDSDDVVYDDEPPGSISLPDQIEDEYSLRTDYEISEINEIDYILYSVDGEIDADLATEVPANANVFGVLSEDDTETEETESENDEYPTGEDAVEYLEQKTKYDFSNRYDTDVTDEFALDHSRAIEQELNFPNIDEYDTDMSIAEALAFESEQSYLAAYAIDNILQTVDKALTESEFGDPADVRGDIDEDQFHNIPEGTTVEVKDRTSNAIGVVESANEYTMTVEEADGNQEKFSISLINEIEAFGDDDAIEHTPERLISDDITSQEVDEYGDELLFDTDDSYVTNEQDAATRRFIENTFERGADPVDVYEKMEEYGVDGDSAIESTAVLAEQLESETDLFDETAVPLKDRDMIDALTKMMRSFQEENDMDPQAIQVSQDVVSAARDWTGSSSNEGTEIIWAAAKRMGNDNIPDDIQLSNVREDQIQGAIEFIEYSREVIRDTLGDEIPIHRGLSGSFGGDKRVEAQNEETVEMEHRSAASWSLSPMVAKKFAYSSGVITKQTVSPEDIAVSMFNGAGFDKELEMVAMGGRKEYESTDSLNADEGIVASEDVSYENAFVEFWESVSELR